MNKKSVAFFLLLSFCTFICAVDVNLGKAHSSLSVDSAVNPIVEADNVEKKKTTTTMAPTTTTTSTMAPTTTTTTTMAPTTTTTTTTMAPTTSATSTTSTKAPDTTTKSPKTTTVAPITTTSAPAPQPYPEPDIGTWNSSCIMLKMAAQLNFTYITKDNKTVQTLYNVPANAVVDHVLCDASLTQSIQVNWGPKNAISSMLVQFDMKNQTVQMSLLRFEIQLTPDRYPDAKENETLSLIHRGFDFSVPANMSYHCTRSQKLNLTESIDRVETIGTVTVHDVQTEAFRTGNSTAFSTVHDCDSSSTSDIVPIAVGIALAALITIVLVAYLCARRRSASQGYVSF